MPDITVPLEVPVNLPEPICSEEDAIETLRRLSMVKVDRHRMADLRRLGAFAHGTGMLNTQRGQVMVSLQRLDEAAATIVRMMDKIEQGGGQNKKAQLTQLALGLSHISARMLEAQKFAVELHGGRASIPANTLDEITSLPFERGQVVQAVANEIHIHASEKKP